MLGSDFFILLITYLNLLVGSELDLVVTATELVRVVTLKPIVKSSRRIPLNWVI